MTNNESMTNTKHVLFVMCFNLFNLHAWGRDARKSGLHLSCSSQSYLLTRKSVETMVSPALIDVVMDVFMPL